MDNNTHGGMEENETTNVTHVSFKECFPNGWKGYFGGKDVISKILEIAGLNRDHEFAWIDSEYYIGNHSVVFIISLRRRGTEIRDKVIVDVFTGDPQLEQIMHVIFNIGHECDYRLVLYDHNFGNENCSSHPIIGNLSTSLINELKGDDIPLTVMGIDLNLNETNSINFQCLDIESINQDDKEPELRKRRFFEKTMNADLLEKYMNKEEMMEMDHIRDRFGEFEFDWEQELLIEKENERLSLSSVKMLDDLMAGYQEQGFPINAVNRNEECAWGSFDSKFSWEGLSVESVVSLSAFWREVSIMLRFMTVPLEKIAAVHKELNDVNMEIHGCHFVIVPDTGQIALLGGIYTGRMTLDKEIVMMAFRGFLYVMIEIASLISKLVESGPCATTKSDELTS